MMPSYFSITMSLPLVTELYLIGIVPPTFKASFLGKNMMPSTKVKYIVRDVTFFNPTAL